MNMYFDSLKLVYSKRVTEELIKRGFTPLGTIQNPREEFKEYDCWVFKWSEDFQKNLDELKGR